MVNQVILDQQHANRKVPPAIEGTRQIDQASIDQIESTETPSQRTKTIMTIFQTLFNNKKETFPNWSQVQRLLERKSLEEIRSHSHENKISQATIEMAEDHLREVEFEDEQEVPETKNAADVFLEWIHATIYH